MQTLSLSQTKMKLSGLFNEVRSSDEEVVVSGNLLTPV